MILDFVGTICDFLLPGHCCVCGSALLGKERHLCSSCISGIPLTYFWIRHCNPMADALNAALQRLRDADDDTSVENYSTASALFFYKGGYRKISQEIKYHGDLPLGKFIGAALGRKLSESRIYDDVDLVIPVPLHWFRRLRRGYNQAQVIAEQVAEKLGVETDIHSLRRNRRTRSQTGVPMYGKAQNVRGAFEVIPSDKLLASKHILLIDDVFTSGSTSAECHRTLRKELASCLGEKKAAGIKISVATIAYVGE